MFTILDYSSALEYSIIRRFTNIVYYYYYNFTPGFVDRPRRGDCTSGQIDGEAGWWTTTIVK